MLEVFKRIKSAGQPKGEISGEKNDRSYVAVLAVFSLILSFALIRAFFDPAMAEQVKSLHISIADVLVLIISFVGYRYFKGRRKSDE